MDRSIEILTHELEDLGNKREESKQEMDNSIKILTHKMEGNRAEINYLRPRVDNVENAIRVAKTYFLDQTQYNMNVLSDRIGYKIGSLQAEVEKDREFGKKLKIELAILKGESFKQNLR